MAEEDQVYGTKAKYKGFFTFKDYYEFCYKWLDGELGWDVAEEAYTEKLNGSVKDLEVKWVATKKVSDYFKFKVKVEFKIIAMSEVEINQGGAKIKTNKGEITTSVKGLLVKDYDGKFESSAKMKLWRGIYEKWIISQRVTQFEDQLIGKCDEFIGQAKAFLDLQGKSRH